MADAVQETPASGFEKPIFPVVLAGIATTALTLFGLFLINKSTDEWNIMGWYAARIIPIGAMLVGGVCASGYALVSYYTGIKIKKWLLLAVLGLQVIAYALAQYIDFCDLHLRYEDGGPVGFFTYFDAATRAFAFKAEHGSRIESPLGVWGYAFRALEAAGFCAGGVMVPAITAALPYCDRCQIYKKTTRLTFIGGNAPTSAAMFKSSEQKREDVLSNEAAWQSALDTVEKFSSLGQTGTVPAFRDLLIPVQAGSKSAARQMRRIEMSLVACPSCADGRLKFVVITGQGRNMKRTDLSSVPVKPDFVRGLLAS